MATPATPTTAELTVLRQLAYRLLASLFLYPRLRRLEELQEVAGELVAESSMWDALPFAGEWESLLNELLAVHLERLTPLEVDYVRLFVVNPRVPPYEAIITDPERMATGWITIQLEREYAEAGLELDPDLKEPPDHVSVELEFMAYLCRRQLEAELGKDQEAGEQFRNRQEAYIRRHLVRWFPRLIDRLGEEAREPLYVALSSAARAFFASELGRMPADEPLLL